MIKAYYRHDFGQHAYENGHIYPDGVDYALRYASKQMVPEILLVSKEVYYHILKLETTKVSGAGGPVMSLAYQWAPGKFIKIDVFPTSSCDPVSVVRVVGVPLNGLERAINRCKGRIKLDHAEINYRPPWQ